MAFFLGLSFGEAYYRDAVKQLQENTYRVNITASGGTMNITKNSDAISIFFNNELLSEKKMTMPIIK